MLIFGFAWFSSFAVLSIIGQSHIDVKTLITDLFQGQNYKKNVKPLLDYAGLGNYQKIDLQIDLSLRCILDVNEQEQKLVTSGNLIIGWYDELLTWDSDDYAGVDQLLLSQSDIWKPDLALWNGFNKLSELGNDFMLVSIDEDGWVQWFPSETFVTKCTIDVRNFPFDEQTCDIMISFWMMNSEWFNIFSTYDGVKLDEYQQNGMWTITNSSTAVIELTSGELGMVFTIKLRRNSTFYVYNLILPIVLLSVITIFTFALPIDSGEKMGYNMTVFLSFAVYMSIVSGELPKLSGSLLGSYMTFELAVSTTIVCFTTVQLRLHHRKDQVPRAIARLVRLLNSKCCRVSRVEDGTGESNHDNNDHTNEVTWDDVMSNLDFVLFWCMVVLKIVGVTTYMAILTSN